MADNLETGSFAAGSATRLLERLAYRVNAAAHAHDERAVHELRVAIRRFGQSLAVFKRTFAARDIKKMRRRLKELMDLSDGVRDYDVGIELVKKSELSGAPAMEERFRERRKESVRVLTPALRQWTARRTTAKWRAGLSPNGAGQLPLAETARERLPRIAKKFLRDGDQASSAKELHRARIEAKKLRYTMEILDPAFGEQFRPAIERMKTVQSALGKINDAHAVRLLVRDAGGDAEIEDWLKKRQKKHTREFRNEWPAFAQELKESVRAFHHPARRPAARTTSAAPKTAAGAA
jgi:CHAD domain-containing protein